MDLHRIAALASLGWCVASCGARTGLELGARGPDDAAVDAVDVPMPRRPACLDATALQRNDIRWRVTGITGHPAVARDGTIYAPTVEPEGGRGLAAIDPCGVVLWRAAGWVGTAATRNIAQRPYARVLDDGQVLLTNSVGASERHGAFRFRPDGTALGMLPVERSLASFVGIPAGSGPVLLAWSGESTRFELARWSLDGARTTLAREFPNGEECAIAGSTVVCYDRAFDLAARRVLWDGPADEILDGTRRHVVGPALDGDTFYAMLFGIRTYVLVARDARTGRERWRRTLETSSSGQTGYVGGAPVVAPDGTVSVYLRLGRGMGSLYTFTRDGTMQGRLSAAAGTQDFLHDATHVVDRDGVRYLAVGAEVVASGASGVQWTRPLPEGVSRGAPALSPFGDLYVVTDANELVAIAAQCAGEADAGWPGARGGARNRNAR